jgi:hypothetical protein
MGKYSGFLGTDMRYETGDLRGEMFVVYGS